MKRLCACLFLIMSMACRTETPVATDTAAPQAAESAPAEVRNVEAPALRNGSLPYVVADGEGGFVVSYVSDTKDALRFVAFRDGRWSEPREIASGNLFVNRADFPSIAVDGRSMVAHWATRNAHGSVVHVARSSDGGETWTEPATPHPDQVSQFGFVSLAPAGDLVWLDGRKLKGGIEGEGDMELRYAMLSRNGSLEHATLLDPRVCDCCQTAMAMTGSGPIVAYRDRTDDEVRDIAYVRRTAGGWSEPKVVHADGWQIAGCPVNGPQVDARGNRVAIAWFTAAGNQRRVYAAFSDDAGETFSAPVQVDVANPSGHVDVALLANGDAAVSWLDGGTLHVRRVSRDGTSGAPVAVGEAIGFPRLAVSHENVAVVWTASDGAHFATIERL